MTLFLRQLSKCFRPSYASTPAKTVVKTTPPPRRQHPTPAYVLAIDQSGSTGYQIRMAFGCKMTRIQAIQLAGERYLQRLAASNPRQLVAVVGFSGTARLYHTLAPVGTAFHSLVRALKSLHPQGTTNLSDGLSLGLQQLGRANTTRGNMVVITDGAANRLTHRLPELTRQAKSSRVRIFTIGVGNNGDSDYDRDLLTHIAHSTGGRFMSAHSFAALCNALSKVS